MTPPSFLASTTTPLLLVLVCLLNYSQLSRAAFVIGTIPSSLPPSVTVVVKRNDAARARRSVSHTLQQQQPPSPKTTNTPLHANKNYYTPDPEDEYRLRQKAAAKGGGAGELAAGFLLGGLLGGPFGALFGAQIGASFGSARATERERKEEMERLGITPEMAEMAREVGAALERGLEGLEATKEALQTQQQFAKRLNNDMESTYAKAREALASDDEDAARQYLLERENLKDKLTKVLTNCRDEKRRVERMEDNVRALEERAVEVDALLRRSVGATALKDSSDGLGSLRMEEDDPLLRKFRDLEGK